MPDFGDVILLARIQFAFTVAFHIVFPAFTIGLASYLAVLEGLALITGRQAYMDVYRYWLRIFAVSFAMGVVSGLVMSYQFGTNWSVFSDKAGPVIGPLMGYEVLIAFFLEAGFLGVMLFGVKRVGPRLHFFATLMVAAGTLFSAFWILSVNSWMQTPAGYGTNAQGQFIPTRLVEGHLQPVLPLSPRPYGHRLLPLDGAGGRRPRVHFISCATAATSRRGHVFAWPCGWRRWWRRCSSWRAICTASTRWNISRPRWRRWRGISIAAGALPLYLFGIPDMESGNARHRSPSPSLAASS